MLSGLLVDSHQRGTSFTGVWDPAPQPRQGVLVPRGRLVHGRSTEVRRSPRRTQPDRDHCHDRDGGGSPIFPSDHQLLDAEPKQRTSSSSTVAATRCPRICASATRSTQPGLHPWKEGRHPHAPPCAVGHTNRSSPPKQGPIRGTYALRQKDRMTRSPAGS